MADSLTTVYSGPRPVRLAGRCVGVREARLRDLAELQAWLDMQWASPLEGLAERLAGLPPEAADALLFDAYAAAQDGPPTWDSAEGQGMLDTPAGLRVLLGIVARSSGLVDELAEATPTLTPAEYAAIRWAFFGRRDTLAIAAMLGVPPSPPRGKILSWGEAICDLECRPGWDREKVANLTLSEFGMYRRGGEPIDPAIQGDWDTLTRLAARQKAADAWKEAADA